MIKSLLTAAALVIGLVALPSAANAYYYHHYYHHYYHPYYHHYYHHYYWGSVAEGALEFHAPEKMPMTFPSVGRLPVSSCVGAEVAAQHGGDWRLSERLRSTDRDQRQEGRPLSDGQHPGPGKDQAKLSVIESNFRTSRTVGLERINQIGDDVIPGRAKTAYRPRGPNSGLQLAQSPKRSCFLARIANNVGRARALTLDVFTRFTAGLPGVE
jgi:hypothetical protein